MWEYHTKGEISPVQITRGRAHVSVAARRRGSAVYYGHDASIIENSVQAMTSPETEDGDDATAREFRDSGRTVVVWRRQIASRVAPHSRRARVTHCFYSPNG